MKVLATHYIGIKDKTGKDILILRRKETKEVSKKEMELLKKEASGKYKVVEEAAK